MKKAIAILTAGVMLCGATASADTLDFLKPIWMQMMDSGSDASEGKLPENVAVTCSDERLTIESCGVLLENDYAAEAHVYAVLRNDSRERLPVRSVQMTALGANGNKLHEENYASHLPDVVEPGETMLVSEWMYAFVKDIGKVASIEINVETGSRAGEKWNRLDDVRAWLDGEYLCVEFTNTTDAMLFGVVCGATVSDADGRILDMLLQSEYDTEDLGVASGSSVVWRKQLEDAATLKIGTDAVCEAWAYKIESL